MQPLKSKIFLALLMRPLSAKELFSVLKKEGMEITYSSVYKSLKELLKEKAVIKIEDKYHPSNAWIQSNLKLLKTAQNCSFSLSENFTVSSSSTFFEILKNFMKNSQRKVMRFSFVPPEFFSNIDFFQNADIQMPQKQQYEKIFAETLRQIGCKPKTRLPQSLDFFINDNAILYLFNSKTFLSDLKRDYLSAIKERNVFLLKYELLEHSPLQSKKESDLSFATKAKKLNI